MQKAKRKTRRRRALSGTSSSSSKLSLKRVTSEAKTPLLIIGGMFIGTQVGKLIDKQITPAVSGLLGLDGASSKFIKPAILGAGGLIVAAMTKNPNVRLISYGVSASGGVMLAKSMNIDVLPLAGADDYNDRAIVPGMGNPNLPALEEGVYGDDDESQIAGDGEDAISGADDAAEELQIA